MELSLRRRQERWVKPAGHGVLRIERAAPLARGLTRAWLFNRHPRYDRSLVYPDATAFTLVSTPTRVQRGISFDGFAQAITLGPTYEPLGPSPVTEVFTMAMVFRAGGVFPAPNTNGFTYCFSNTGLSDNACLSFAWPSGGSANRIRWFERNEAGTNANIDGATTGLVNDGRRHVAVLSRASDTSRTLYVDGKSEGSSASNVDLSATTFTKVAFGCLGRTSNVAFGAVNLEACYLWRGRALSQADAAGLYAMPFAPVLSLLPSRAVKSFAPPPPGTSSAYPAPGMQFIRPRLHRRDVYRQAW